MDDADWKRWAEAGPFKQSSGQIVEIRPQGVGPHSSFDEYFSVERWRSCDQGHRYTPNPVEHSRLVIPQSCEARITGLLAQRPSIHALCLLTSHQTAVCWTVSWEFVHPLPKTAFFLLSKRTNLQFNPNKHKREGEED